MSDPSQARPIPGQVWYVLTPEQRCAAVLLLGLLLIGMVLETLGVGLVLPALAVMTEGDLGSKYPMVQPVLTRLGAPSREQLVVGGMLLLAAVSLVKALFLATIAWRQAFFVIAVRVELAQRLFIGYMRRPCTFHLQRNSAQLIVTANSETSVFASGVDFALLVITETMVLLGISVLLLVVEPVGTLLMATVLGAAVWGFNRLTRDRVLRWGEERQLHAASGTSICSRGWAASSRSSGSSWSGVSPSPSPMRTPRATS